MESDKAVASRDEDHEYGQLSQISHGRGQAQCDTDEKGHTGFLRPDAISHPRLLVPRSSIRDTRDLQRPRRTTVGATMAAAAFTTFGPQTQISTRVSNLTSGDEVDPDTSDIAVRCLPGSMQEPTCSRPLTPSRPVAQAAIRLATKRHSASIESLAKRRRYCIEESADVCAESSSTKEDRANISFSPPAPRCYIDFRKPTTMRACFSTRLRRTTSEHAPVSSLSIASGSKNGLSSSGMNTLNSPSLRVTPSNSSAAEDAGNRTRSILNLDHSDIHQAMTTDSLIEIKCQTVDIRSRILDLRSAACDQATLKTLSLCEEVVVDRLQHLDAILASQKAAQLPTPMSSPPATDPSVALAIPPRPKPTQSRRASTMQHYRATNDAREHVDDPSFAFARDHLVHLSAHAEPTASMDLQDIDVHDTSGPNSQSIPFHDSDDEPWRQLDPSDFSLDPLKATRTTNVSRPSVPALPRRQRSKGKGIDLGLFHEAPLHTKLLRTLEDVFGLQSFRENQREACTASIEGRDVLVVMPTGGGKSLCFQLPAVVKNADMGGVTVVVSPLVALMHDQTCTLRDKGVKVARFYAGQTSKEADSVHRLLRMPGRRPALLYVSPEKLDQSERLRADLTMLYEAGLFVRLVVDEAHCIYTWEAFRGSYENLARMRDDYPDVPIIALTAAVNHKTLNNIITRLQMQNCIRLRARSSDRPNLRYGVLYSGGSNTEIAEIVKEQYPGKTGIIYCPSRKKCEQLAKHLRKSNILADHYHAEAGAPHKESVQSKWLKGDIEVVVATTAFGMGIDKPDVRFVIHTAMPHSLDNYYQETGRAGRDGKRSECILYYHWVDVMHRITLSQQDASETSHRSSQRAERVSEDARRIMQYCLNNVDCRRKQLLAHFDEQFNPEDCHEPCDNCQRRASVELIDLSKHAIRLITLVQRAQKANIHPARGSLLDAFTGRLRTRGTYYYEKLRALSVAIGAPTEEREESRSTIERLHDLLIARGILVTSRENNETSWKNNYTHAGDAAIEFLQKPVPLVLGVARAGRPKVGEQEDPPSASARRRSQRTRSFVAHSQGTETDQYDFTIGLPMDGNDSDSPEFTRTPTRKTRIRPVTSSASSALSISYKADGLDESPTTSQSMLPQEHCLQDLAEYREKIVPKLPERIADMLGDDILELLSVTLPVDVRGVERVLEQCGLDGAVFRGTSRLGLLSGIARICLRYHPTQQSNEESLS